MTLTPGAYLKYRRTAALLSIADVAAKVGTMPHLSERERIELLDMIEADVQPADFSTIVALRRTYAFDLGVLELLVAIAQGHAFDPPQLCRICACSDHDRCVRIWGSCSWAEPDLCTACAPLLAKAA